MFPPPLQFVSTAPKGRGWNCMRLRRSSVGLRGKRKSLVFRNRSQRESWIHRHQQSRLRDRKIVLCLDFGRYSSWYTERSTSTALHGGSFQPYEASGGNSELDIDFSCINNLSLIDSTYVTGTNWNGHLPYATQPTLNTVVTPGIIINSTHRAHSQGPQPQWVLAPRNPLPQAHSMSSPGKELLHVN